jgi:stalled ribosome rescue protein Dom34
MTRSEGEMMTTLTLQAMENFFSTVYQAILRLLPFQTLKAIVIASPGFTKETVRCVVTRRKR